MIRRNKLREMLNAGQPTLGTHLHSSSGPLWWRWWVTPVCLIMSSL